MNLSQFAIRRHRRRHAGGGGAAGLTGQEQAEAGRPATLTTTVRWTLTLKAVRPPWNPHARSY